MKEIVREGLSEKDRTGAGFNPSMYTGMRRMETLRKKKRSPLKCKRNRRVKMIKM